MNTDELKLALTHDNLYSELEAAKARACKCRGWDILPAQAKLALVIMEVAWMIKFLEYRSSFSEKRKDNQILLDLLTADLRVSAEAMFSEDKY